MAEMIQVAIDGKQTEVPAGTYVLKAARQVGVEIPALCDSELVEPYGACRVCSVEVSDGRKQRIVTACNYPILKPTEVFTRSERALAIRRLTLEMMLARWPNVEVLKEAAADVGITAARFAHPERNEAANACILCGLCVRVCHEAVWHKVLAFENRGATRRVVMPYGQQAETCVSCESCATVCPTGAITFVDDPNHPADPARIRRAGAELTREVVLLDKSQCRMREVGTAHLVEIMNDYDLLPTHNHRFGRHPDAHRIASDKWTAGFTQGAADGCALGCEMACAKGVDGFVLRTGPDRGKKVLVDGPEYETAAGVGSNLGIFEPWAVIEQNYYCDQYGIDTISWGALMAFVMECYEAGILNQERTGGLDLSFGQAQNVLEVMHQMARGEGFGLVAGQGVRRMKKLFAEQYGADPAFLQDIGMENKGLEYSMYVSKESLAQQGGYALTNKGPQHDEAWLIFMDMVNKQIPTFEDKAEALHYFPIFRTWFGLHGLCKLPWNDVEPEDNAESEAPAKVPKHVQGYCNLVAGMTGKEVSPEDLILQSERVYNLQRIFNLKMGFGTRPHDKPPYRSVGPVTAAEYLSRQERYDQQLKDEIGLDPTTMSLDEKRAAVREYREDRYQQLCDAVYKRRGWTTDGIPTLAKVRSLGIDEVPGLVDLLQAHGVTE
ncbi:MAG: (2Fe-2S)-binding protein [Deltaproteobacteria bacterium]|nr:(2Fe-2S)-binding protein [Deltaproteobacteria bacterium]